MPRGFLSLLEVILGYLVRFRIYLVGLLTFYQGESCHHFLLVCAFSPALTCVFSRSVIHKQHLLGGGGASCIGGRSPNLGRAPGPGAGSALAFVRSVQRERESEAHPPPHPQHHRCFIAGQAAGWVGSCPAPKRFSVFSGITRSLWLFLVLVALPILLGGGTLYPRDPFRPPPVPRV